MADVKSPSKRFHSNLLELCDLSTETVQWLADSGVKMKIGAMTMNILKGVISSWDPIESVNGFIERSYAYWEKIKVKDEDFLINNSKVLFSEVASSHIDSFTILFTMKDENGEPLIPKETKDSIWSIIHAMIRVAICHIHESREPKLVNIEGVGKRIYTVEFFPQIKVKDMVSEWKVKLQS